MHWFILLLASVCEVAWAVGLKYTGNLTRFWPTAGVGVALIASVGLLAIAVRGLPIGTAYAVWTGLGATGTAIAGILLFGEGTSPARLACLTLIVAGVVGLKFFPK